MLDIGLAVARGGYCLGETKCEEGDVLYIAMEDNERRLQSRITKILGFAAKWPAWFQYATAWPRADAGGLDAIRTWITSAEKPRLIVVDILAMFRSPRRKDQQPYEADYAAIEGLQAIASETGVAIVIVHHLGKPGVPNKANQLLKDAILEAADKAGGREGLVGYLTQQAKRHPQTFLGLLGRVLPLQVQSSGENSVRFTIRHIVDGGERNGQVLDLPARVVEH
jgi:hypothetical protein